MANSSLNLEINVDRKLAGIAALIGALDQLTERVEVTARFEQLATTLETVEGSARKAESSMKWIEDFTKNTPFQLENVSEAFIKLRAYGINPTTGTLKTLGDTASAMGKPINQAVERLADAIVGENERLKEFGIKSSKIGDEIKYSWVTASGETKDILIDNNKDIIESTLNSIFNEKYAGRMEKQSKTYNGMLSNLQDNFTLMSKNAIISSGLFDILKQAIGDVNTNFKDNNLETEKNVELMTSLEAVYFSLKTTLQVVGFSFESLGNVGGVVIDEMEDGFLRVYKSLLELDRNFAEVRMDFNKLVGDAKGYNDALAMWNRRNLRIVETRKKIKDNELEINEGLSEQYKITNDLAESIRKSEEAGNKRISSAEAYNERIQISNIYKEQEIKLLKEYERLNEDFSNKKISSLVYETNILGLNKQISDAYNLSISKSLTIVGTQLSSGKISLSEYMEEYKKFLTLSKGDVFKDFKVDDTSEEKEKIYSKEYNDLVKSLDKSIKRLRDNNKDKYTLLVEEYNYKISIAENNSETLLKINEEYNLKLENLNKEEIEKFKKNEEEKNKIAAEALKDKLNKIQQLERDITRYETGDKVSDLQYRYNLELKSIEEFYSDQEELRKLNADLKLEELRQNHRNEDEIKDFHDKNEIEKAEIQSKKLQDIENAKQDFMLSRASGFFGDSMTMLKGFQEAGLIEGKKAAKAQQRLAVVQTTIETYKAAQQRYTSLSSIPYVGPVLGRARAGRAIATGLARVQQIKSQRFHTGGFIGTENRGQGSLKSDEVPTILQTGEGVVSRRGMRELDKLNRGEQPSESSSTEVNVAIFDNRQNAEDFLQTRKGKKIIKEIQ